MKRQEFIDSIKDLNIEELAQDRFSKCIASEEEAKKLGMEPGTVIMFTK